MPLSSMQNSSAERIQSAARGMRNRRMQRLKSSAERIQSAARGMRNRRMQRLKSSAVLKQFINKHKRNADLVELKKADPLSAEQLDAVIHTTFILAVKSLSEGNGYENIKNSVLGLYQILFQSGLKNNAKNKTKKLLDLVVVPVLDYTNRVKEGKPLNNKMHKLGKASIRAALENQTLTRNWNNTMKAELLKLTMQPAMVSTNNKANRDRKHQNFLNKMPNVFEFVKNLDRSAPGCRFVTVEGMRSILMKMQIRQLQHHGVALVDRRPGSNVNKLGSGYWYSQGDNYLAAYMLVHTKPPSVRDAAWLTFAPLFRAQLLIIQYTSNLTMEHFNFTQNPETDPVFFMLGLRQPFSFWLKDFDFCNVASFVADELIRAHDKLTFYMELTHDWYEFWATFVKAFVRTKLELPRVEDVCQLALVLFHFNARVNDIVDKRLPYFVQSLRYYDRQTGKGTLRTYNEYIQPAYGRRFRKNPVPVPVTIANTWYNGLFKNIRNHELATRGPQPAVDPEQSGAQHHRQTHSVAHRLSSAVARQNHQRIVDEILRNFEKNQQKKPKLRMIHEITG